MSSKTIPVSPKLTEAISLDLRLPIASDGGVRTSTFPLLTTKLHSLKANGRTHTSCRSLLMCCPPFPIIAPAICRGDIRNNYWWFDWRGSADRTYTARNEDAENFVGLAESFRPGRPVVVVHVEARVDTSILLALDRVVSLHFAQIWNQNRKSRAINN